MERRAREIVSTGEAPAAIGPYSQAVRAGDLVFASGQIGLDPATGRMVEGGTRAQARRCLENLRAVLEAAGSGMEGCLRLTVYLVDMEEYPAVNEVYAEFFAQDPPARAAVEVRRLPRDARVEIDAIAVAPPRS